MKIAWACVLAGVLNVLAMPSIAEPGPIGRWLMGEPLSLWDKGCLRRMKRRDERPTPSGRTGENSHGGLHPTIGTTMRLTSSSTCRASATIQRTKNAMSCAAIS